jgi:methionyl-tRNA formyltransferase
LRIVFMGTGPISATSLAALIEAGHEIPLVFTRPDAPRGRHGTPVPPEVKVLAERHGQPLMQPRRIRDPECLPALRDVAPRAIVVVAYDQLLPVEMLDLPEHGCINVHLSLLPRHRGAAPVHYAILAGDEVTGVTVMRMAEKFDTGPILRTRELAIEPGETSGELAPRLAHLGAECLGRVLVDLEAGREVEERPQDAALATRAPKLKKEDGRIDWTAPAAQVARHVRAMTPWPGAFTEVAAAEVVAAGTRLLLLEAEPIAGAGDPGRVLVAEGGGIVVAAGAGAVRITRLQRPGRTALSARAFLNGCALRPGDRFGRSSASSRSE